MSPYPICVGQQFQTFIAEELALLQMEKKIESFIEHPILHFLNTEANSSVQKLHHSFPLFSIKVYIFPSLKLIHVCKSYIPLFLPPINLAGLNGLRSTILEQPSTTSSATAAPVAGPFRMPQQLCPVAT